MVILFSLGYPLTEQLRASPEGLFQSRVYRRGRTFLRAFPGVVKSIAADGDYTNRPFDTTSGSDITDVVITITDKPATLSGVVRDRQGTNIREGAVIVFPAERALWTNFGVEPLPIRTATYFGVRGYQIPSLPAGEYVRDCGGALDASRLAGSAVFSRGGAIRDARDVDVGYALRARPDSAAGCPQVMRQGWTVVLATLTLVPAVGGRVPDDRRQAASPARLTGIVITTDISPQPVRRAIVSLTGGDRPLGYHTISDDDGRFEFAALPAGRYSLSAARPTFVTIAYGSTRPGRPGTSISLAPGQQLSDVRVVLARGAIITGIVRDITGEPVPDLEVRVEPRGSTAASAAKPLTVMTDDQGRYRAFGLPAGTYVVAARPRTSTSDLDVPADADVDATLAALRQRRGVTAPPSPVPAKPKAATNFAPVYHPSELTLDAGTGVAVTAGEERSGIDITLRLLSTWSVLGSVVTADAETRSLIRPMLTTLSGVFGPGHPDDRSRSGRRISLSERCARPIPIVGPGPDRGSQASLAGFVGRAGHGAVRVLESRLYGDERGRDRAIGGDAAVPDHCRPYRSRWQWRDAA